ncbi:MAG: DUF962 domain-containing protein [Gammaproteobacteria bacterium]
MPTVPSARPIDVLLARYRESHRNALNERIHCVCVPAIVFALLGLLWSVHWVLALAAFGASMRYYLDLSRPFALGMVGMILPMLVLLALLPAMTVLPLSIGIFVLAWIGQFIGHHIEGRKPSFMDDVRFLLIGPLFVLGVLYRRLNLAW